MPTYNRLPWSMIAELCAIAGLDHRLVYRIEIKPHHAVFEFYLRNDEGNLYVDPETQRIACDAIALLIEDPS